MPKEKSANPVAAQHKADKRASIKKQKAQQQSQRNERLAKRNPQRLQKQLDDLKALEATSQLRPRDKQTLQQLERDLKAVHRARETLGDRAPQFRSEQRERREGREGGDRDTRGTKRRRDHDGGSDDEVTDDEVRSIPMPRDTPPPVPRRNPRDNNNRKEREKKEVAPAQTTYSSAPVLRNFASENKRFVPAAVAANIARTKGTGGRLLEPEEVERLERAGYGGQQLHQQQGQSGEGQDGGRSDMKEGMRDDIAGVAREMEKEAEFGIMEDAARRSDGGELDGAQQGSAAERQLGKVEMEEVEDEDL